ncbi:MAG: vWA domain-containing protein [Chlamydiota bacterium]
MTFFQIDLQAFWIAIGYLVFMTIAWWLWSLKNYARQPHLLYSDLSLIKTSTSSLKIKLKKLPLYLRLIALGIFIIAFTDPQIRQQNLDQEGLSPPSLPKEGLAIYLVLDTSSSMAQIMAPSEDGQELKRIEALKMLSAKFINGDAGLGLSGRSQDLIGIVSFARVPRILAPLTFDHATILDRLHQLKTTQTPQDDGTALGYAIFKTAHLIAATKYYARESSDMVAYDIKNTIMIVLTDGAQNPNPLDQENPLRNISIADASQYAAENDIKLYIIDVEPLILQSRFRSSLQKLEDAAKRTGGQFYVADSPSKLKGVYSQIDLLETSTLPKERKADDGAPSPPIESERLNSYYPHFILAGLIMLFSAIFLESTWLRRLP